MMKKSVEELEEQMRSMIKVTDTVEVVEPVAIRTHWATEGDDEELNDLVAWKRANPEMLEDEEFKAQLAEFVEEAHKGLAVKPRPEAVKRMASLLKEEIGEEELKNRVKKVHFMGYDKHGSKGEGVYCSCGMFKLHNRGKVLAAWADKHYEKYGHYWKRS